MFDLWGGHLRQKWFLVVDYGVRVDLRGVRSGLECQIWWILAVNSGLDPISREGGVVSEDDGIGGSGQGTSH